MRPFGLGQNRDCRGFGPHHHQISLYFAGERDKVVRIVGLYGAQLGMLGYARISGRGDQLRQKRRLGDLPGQGVLSAAGTDQQNFHGRFNL